MRKAILWICLIPLLEGSPLSDTPEDAAKNFYSTVMAISEKGCLPKENELRRLAPLMSKRLTALFRDALAYREQFIKDHPPRRSKEGYLMLDKPPFSDGDCFSSNFEGATSFKIGKSNESGNKFRIDLNLEYIDATNLQKPFAWTDAIYVIQEDRRFVVDDMEFLGDWPFGTRGLLSNILKSR